jgi:hypothetical protein
MRCSSQNLASMLVLRSTVASVEESFETLPSSTFVLHFSISVRSASPLHLSATSSIRPALSVEAFVTSVDPLFWTSVKHAICEFVAPISNLSLASASGLSPTLICRLSKVIGVINSACVVIGVVGKEINIQKNLAIYEGE